MLSRTKLERRDSTYVGHVTGDHSGMCGDEVEGEDLVLDTGRKARVACKRSYGKRQTFVRAGFEKWDCVAHA